LSVLICPIEAHILRFSGFLILSKGKNKGGLKGLKMALIISHYLIDTKNAIIIIRVMKIIKTNKLLKGGFLCFQK
jgi:hypothetical protein